MYTKRDMATFLQLFLKKRASEIAPDQNMVTPNTPVTASTGYFQQQLPASAYANPAYSNNLSQVPTTLQVKPSSTIIPTAQEQNPESIGSRYTAGSQPNTSIPMQFRPQGNQ